MKLLQPQRWLVPAVLGTMLANWTLLFLFELRPGSAPIHDTLPLGYLTFLFGTPVGIGLTLLSILTDVLLRRFEQRALPTGRRAWLVSLLTTLLFFLAEEGVLAVADSLSPLKPALLLTGMTLTAGVVVLGVRLLFGNREQPSW